MYETINRYIDRLLSESTPAVPLWNVENIRAGKSPKWNYVDGCMMTALLRLYEISGDKKYLDFVDNFINFYVNEDGSILGYDPADCNLDDINEGRVLFDLYRLTGKEKYRRAIDLLKSQLDNQPRTKTGNFWHKLIYPNQIWLDGIYMAQPFLCRYATEFADGDYSDIEKQIVNVYSLMFNRRKGLYYHGIDISLQVFWANKKTGLSESFWLRAIGWYLVALADILGFMKDGKSKERLTKVFLRSIDGIAQYVDSKEKMLFQVVDAGKREGNYLETSGSCMVAYAMLKGARLGVLNKKYAALGQEIFDGVCKKYLSENKEGQLNLDGICLVAGLGPENNTRRNGKFEYYISEPVVSNDAKGVAPFILAYTELLAKK
jgi:unsaturated rhamnogalacturonyl hydrolase